MITGKINTNISFGKTPVMLCEMKKNNDNTRINATLYEMDIRDRNDLDEIQFSRTAKSLYFQAEKDSKYMNPYRKYYLLKNDSSNEVISCASVSSHLRRTEGKPTGISSVIDDFEGNYRYLNPEEPLLAFLADSAIKTYKQNIIVGSSDFDENALKRNKFSKSKIGEWYIPEQRFAQIIDQAEKRYNMIV